MNKKVGTGGVSVGISLKQDVRVIPATKNSTVNHVQLNEQTGVRVAAYCRVSTGDESQQTSYTSQKAFYTRLITDKVGWVMAGIYADEGLSGTCRAKRVQFNKMMDDALHGKIGYIVTKSISRFARNTVDTLDCVRQLREQNPPVGIYFEKENIDTLDATGELFLTILSAMAQDESRSISDNIRWAFQKRFQEGRPQINLNRMLGYDMGSNGEWLINEKQAETVRIIFKLYAEGNNASTIALRLNSEERLTVNNNHWSSKSVLVILDNEKYVGDLAMQKTITKDFLTHKSIINRGEAPMYYIKDHHSAIIDRDTWNRVQLILKQRRTKTSESEEPNNNVESSLSIHINLFCAHCEKQFVRLSYVSTAKNYSDERSLESEGADEKLYSEKYTYRYDVYRCATRIDDDTSCSAENYCEIALQQSFMEAIYTIREDYLKREQDSWLCTQFTKSHKAVNATTSDRKSPFDKPTAHESLTLFIKSIESLPEPTMDFYNFDKGLYHAFIIKGIARNDTVLYTTNFGVPIVTSGNTRALSDFTQKTRLLPDGTPELLTEPWQVSGKKLGYKRTKRKRVKKE